MASELLGVVVIGLNPQQSSTRLPASIEALACCLSQQRTEGVGRRQNKKATVVVRAGLRLRYAIEYT